MHYGGIGRSHRVDCDLVLNPVYSEEETAASARKLLAAIRVTCERIQDQISLIGEPDPESGGRFSV